MKHVPDLQGEPLSVAPAELRQFVEAEIERLMAFLDGLDGDPELEANGDEADASYPERGGLCVGDSTLSSPHEDDELSGDENEPSLGSANPTIWGNGGVWSSPTPEADLEDEHDGAEDDRDQEGDDDPDREPSLGWTIDGAAGRAVDQRTCDLEVQDHAAVKPQDRTNWQGPQISAESTYRKFLYGLTKEQRPGFCKRMTEQSGTTSVIAG